MAWVIPSLDLSKPEGTVSPDTIYEVEQLASQPLFFEMFDGEVGKYSVMLLLIFRVKIDTEIFFPLYSVFW